MTDPAPLTDEELALAARGVFLHHAPAGSHWCALRYREHFDPCCCECLPCERQEHRDRPPHPGPLTDEELAEIEARFTAAQWSGVDAPRDARRLIADLRAARAEVERHKLRAEQAEAAMARLDRLLSENVQAGRERAAEVERLRGEREQMLDALVAVGGDIADRWEAENG